MLRFLSDRPLRLPRLLPPMRRAGDPRIFGFNDERADIVAAVVRTATSRLSVTRARMEAALAETAFDEIRRLESQRDHEAASMLGEWRTLPRRIPRMSDAEAAAELARVAERMAWDVAGNFDQRVYDFAVGAAPKLMMGVMRPSELPATLTATGGLESVDELLRVEGAIDDLRALQNVATLVYVPTHSSNLDSVVLGYALERVGLPPVMYGAGKNLFTNPILSFFMHNLGAYRVDRRIGARLYKDVLKAYAGETVRRGYHSLFFPGGTRSRSNMIESKLKLGLAGAAVEAFAQRRAAGDSRPILFVPTTINYELVLEAETLIDDWLVEAGKSRYIIEDDESSRLDRWVAFFRRVAHMNAAGVIRFGDPIDPFGNGVDRSARSLGPSGNVVDASSYVMHRGKVRVDPARDAAYTRDLGNLLPSIFQRETVVMGTQLVAHVLFRHLVSETGDLDLFQRLRLRGEISIAREALVEEVEVARRALSGLVERNVVHATREILSGSASDLVDRTFAILRGYHRKHAVSESDGKVTIVEPSLVLYYQNRLVPFAERLATTERHAKAARFIANLGAQR